MTNGTNGKSGLDARDRKGRFTKGNPGGPGGNRLQGQHLLREAIRNEFKPSEIAALLRKLYDMAMAGDSHAAKEVLDRCVGKPTQPITTEGDDGERVPVRIVFEMPKSIDTTPGDN